MEKARIKYVVTIGMLISIILNGITGIIRLPLFRYSGPFIVQIRIIHEWAGVSFVIFALVHIIFNFPWIILNTKNLFKKMYKK